MAELSAVVVPDMWASISLDVLRKNIVLVPLVWRDFEAVVASYGDTVNTRKPTKRIVRAWGGQEDTGDLANKEIVVERPTAINVAITLNFHEYVSWMEEDKIATLSIQSLRELLVEPAVIPLAERIDRTGYTEFITGTDGDGNSIGQTPLAGTPSGILQSDDIVNLMKAQEDEECPSPKRLIFSTEHKSEALKQDLFVQANTAGSDSALRRAELGMLYDYSTYWTQNLPEDTSGPQSIGFHQTALAYITRLLRSVPPGLGTISSVQNYEGYALRLQVSHKHRGMGIDVSIDSLWGWKLLDAAKARRLVG